MTTRLLILPLLFCCVSLTFAQKPPLPSKVIPDGLGYNIHFTDAKPGELEMLAGSGATIIRMDFVWDATERQKGVYDFSVYERLTDSLEKHNIRPLYILDYGNRHYDQGLSPYTDEGRKAFAKWAAAAAVHFKDRGILWEMWNEPNLTQFWKPKTNPDDYIKLALEVGQALREAAPNELYIGPATSDIDFDFLEKCFKAGLLEYWDAVSVHPYRQREPESVIPEYAKLRWMIDKYASEGKHIPILSAEWGYSSVWANYDDEVQGKMLPRQWMINLACEIPVSIWYDWHDDGSDPKEPEHHFGTVNHEYHQGRSPVYDPKPAYLAAKTFTEIFKGFQYNKRLDVGVGSGDVYVFLFNQGKEIRLAAWTTSKEPCSIFVPCDFGTKFRIIDYLGREKSKQIALVDCLTVTDEPLYLIPENEDTVLAKAAEFPSLPMVFYLTKSNLKEIDILPPQYRFPEICYSPEKFRSPNPMLFYLSVFVDAANEKYFMQSIKIHSTNPISIRPWLEIGGQMSLHIDNPSGDAFSGELGHYHPVGGAQSANIELHEGEKQRIITFPSRPVYLLDATLHFGDEDKDRFYEVVAGKQSIFSPLDDFTQYTTETLNTAWGVFPDGDANVNSEQSIEAAENGMVKLTYKFDAGWKFLRLAPKEAALRKIEGEPKELTFRVEGDGSGNSVRLRFTEARGQTFQVNGGTMPEKKPYYFSFPLNGTNASHWGGPNDGAIQYPIMIDSIIIDGLSNPSDRNTIEISSPVLVY